MQRFSNVTIRIGIQAALRCICERSAEEIPDVILLMMKAGTKYTM